MTVGVIGAIILACFFVAVIVFIIYKNSRKKKIEKSKSQIEKLRSIAENESNSIKKKIMNDHIATLILNDCERRLRPMIQKYAKKVTKKPTPELKELLKQYENELESALSDAQLLRFDMTSELSESEKEKYAAFCEAFKAFRNSKKTWIIVSKESNTQHKASAKIIIDRNSFRFSCGFFNELKIPYEVPVVPISSQRNYYFYPRFVIITKSLGDFDVLPIEKVNLRYSSQRFQEEKTIPSDAQRIGTTYMYVNKDGGPDRRYSYNPAIPVLLYGEIVIEPMGNIFQVSNNLAAANLSKAYMELKTKSAKSDYSSLSDGLLGIALRALNEETGDNVEIVSKISRLYFEDICFECKQLQKYTNSLIEDDGFLDIVSKTINGSIVINGKELKETKDKIPFYVWGDVVNCFKRLGHPIDLDKIEGLGLLVLSTLFFFSNEEIKYERLKRLYSKYKTTTENMLKNASEASNDNDGNYMLELCLRSYDKQLHNQFVVYLYRFASLVVKADKKVTGKESDCLNKILSLKEPEREEDVFSTIPIENKMRTATLTQHHNPLMELETLIGLSSVKSEINSLTNYIKIQKMRQEKGMKVSPMSYHCVFTGNPGTGKTTVARIVSQIYKELGILKKGHLVETDRSGLVAEYVGQTAVKTNKTIDSAIDGILFIDEAYSLVNDGNSDYGKEAIATLLKRMEDDRDRLVVILAGYTNEMKRFIDSNPGLQSRFNRYIEFPDYSSDELFQIFQSNAKKYDYKLTEDAQIILRDIMEKVVSEKDCNFGNGRFVRNLFEKTVENQANRLSSKADVTSETLALIEKVDIQKSANT